MEHRIFFTVSFVQKRKIEVILQSSSQSTDPGLQYKMEEFSCSMDMSRLLLHRTWSVMAFASSQKSFADHSLQEKIKLPV